MENDKKPLSERHAELARIAHEAIVGLRDLRLLIETACIVARGNKQWEAELEMLVISSELYQIVPDLARQEGFVEAERAKYSKERLGDNRRARRRAKMRYAEGKERDDE